MTLLVKNKRRFHRFPWYARPWWRRLRDFGVARPVPGFNKARLWSSAAIGSAAAVIAMVALVTVVYAHSETAAGNCHFHTDSGEQHCAPDKQRELEEDAPAVVQPLAEDGAAGSTAGNGQTVEKNRSVVDQFEKMEQQTRLIAGIQGGLARLGYQPGPPTGMMNDATEAAIRAFQNDNLLPPSGQPTLSLLTIIEDELDARRSRR